MDGISTMTQKGQVAIPKGIRDYFNLKPSDKINFTVEGNKIVAKKILDIDEMMGIIPVKKPLSKQKIKALIRTQVLKKYASRS